MLLRKLGDNLCCLRLSNCEPCNGSAQSGLQPKATCSCRNQVSPMSMIIAYLTVDSGFDAFGKFTTGIDPLCKA